MSLPSLSLRGKVAIITGANGGLGRTMALAFAEAEADVVVADIVTGGLEETVREIHKLGRRSLAIQMDVTKKADVDKMVQKTIKELGGVNILVNSAGITTRVTPMEISEDEWDRVININLKGCLFCAQVVGKRMIKQKTGGSIINISATGAIRAVVNRAGYGSAKIGLIMLTKQLAMELGPQNIRVNALAPGWIKTDMTRDLWGNPEKLWQTTATVPLGRWAEPSEVTSVALFLASEAASFVNGATIVVDGGEIAG